MIEDLLWFGIKWDLGPSSETIIPEGLKVKGENTKKAGKIKLNSKGVDILSKPLKEKKELNVEKEVVSDVVCVEGVTVLVSPAMSSGGVGAVKSIHGSQNSVYTINTKKTKIDHNREFVFSHSTERDILSRKKSIDENSYGKFFCGVELRPYSATFHQSQRMPLYTAAWKKLLDLQLGAI